MLPLRSSLTHPPLAVGMNVEVSEENNEGRGIRDEGVMHPLGEVAVDVQGVHTVQSGSTKLQLRRERGEGRGGKGRGGWMDIMTSGKCREGRRMGKCDPV